MAERLVVLVLDGDSCAAVSSCLHTMGDNKPHNKPA